MTQDEIIRFAIQCRLVTTGNRDGIYMDALTEFARLVAAKEREACAEVCDELVNEENSEDYRNAANWCSVRIRARGEA